MNVILTMDFFPAGCPSFEIALDLGYFVKDIRGKVAMTQWWNGKNAGIIDFTNEGTRGRFYRPILF